jgi:hypothetical protein
MAYPGPTAKHQLCLDNSEIVPETGFTVIRSQDRELIGLEYVTNSQPEIVMIFSNQNHHRVHINLYRRGCKGDRT